MIADLHVIVIFHANPAFGTSFNFLNVIFEAAQGFQLPFIYHNIEKLSVLFKQSDHIIILLSWIA